MSLHHAHRFITRVNASKSLREELESLHAQACTHEALCSLGTRHGLHFDASDLDRAFAIDWQMRARRLAYGEHFSPPQSNDAGRGLA